MEIKPKRQPEAGYGLIIATRPTVFSQMFYWQQPAKKLGWRGISWIRFITAPIIAPALLKTQHCRLKGIVTGS
jgi:ABC-type uncharacterized transport system permease subunit